MMRFRFPRLRRRGGSTPAYRPRRGTQLVAISPGYVECGRCGQRRIGSGEADADHLGWLMGGHECTLSDDMIDEQRRAELPAVDTLDARICPQCRRKDVKHIAYVEPDLETRAATRDDVLGLIRDTMEIDPCECRIKLHRWGLHGYQYSDQWTAWEWRRQ